ncbi:unnamed protein product, partial [Iphiclides podalirius]
MQRCGITIFESRLYVPQLNSTRAFWEYVNMMFNKPDLDRLKKVGPDRACAEWVLRNGGKVTWADGKKLSDYNLLPPEEQKGPKLIEIDGTDSSISHHGFPHLSGCTMLKKIVLHNNSYIDDRALKGLAYGKDVLTFVQVSKCVNVKDIGLKELVALKNLQTLILYDLTSVQNIEDCKHFIKSGLPACKILGDADDIIS